MYESKFGYASRWPEGVWLYEWWNALFSTKDSWTLACRQVLIRKYFYTTTRRNLHNDKFTSVLRHPDVIETLIQNLISELKSKQRSDCEKLSTRKTKQQNKIAIKINSLKIPYFSCLCTFLCWRLSTADLAVGMFSSMPTHRELYMKCFHK